MDFWAQHKDFVLKVLAGFGVFLVALIARGITYGDELENAQSQHTILQGKIRRLKIGNVSKIRELEDAANELRKNADTILGQIGWNAADEGLDRELLTRILSYTRSYQEASGGERTAMVDQAQSAIQSDLNGGFGQLRLKVRDELVEEASEKNIEIVEGIGFSGVTEIEGEQLRGYLMALELTARLLRLCIDVRALSVPEVRIEMKQGREAIPGANPEFLREYVVELTCRTSQDGLSKIINRSDEGKRVPMRELKIERTTRPPDHVDVTVRMVALSADPTVPFKLEKEEGK